GVGMTPPKVLGAPNPWSSVMMSNTLGAPLGGTTRGRHQGVDSEAFSLITPPKLGSGGGNCLPSSVVVAVADPGGPEVCWACTMGIMGNIMTAASSAGEITLPKVRVNSGIVLPPAVSNVSESEAPADQRAVDDE